MNDQKHVAGLGDLCLGILPLWQEQVNTVRVQTEDAICALSSRFIKIAEKLGAEHSTDINDLLVSLQFADRTGQILGAISNDIAKLVGELTAGDAPVLDVAKWREHLASTYTTREQHAIHAGDAGSTVEPGDDISFF